MERALNVGQRFLVYRLQPRKREFGLKRARQPQDFFQEGLVVVESAALVD